MICKEWQRRICFSLSLPFLPLLHSPESLAADVLDPNATEQVKAPDRWRKLDRRGLDPVS